MTRPFRLIASLLPLCLVALHLAAQRSPEPFTTEQAAAPDQTPLRLEVISIRPHHFTGDDPSNRRVQPGGRLVITATSVRTLLRVAFGTDEKRMTGAPAWVDSEAFDIDATTVDRAEVTTPKQLQEVMLSLLEDRFQLKFHREAKDGAVYWLELNKPDRPGPGLVPSPAASTPNMSVNSNAARVAMKATRASMADLAAAISKQAGRPVEDHTGLAGEFDFGMEWAADQTADSTFPSLSSAMSDQLGLKLRQAKGKIEMISIDRIERPSSN